MIKAGTTVYHRIKVKIDTAVIAAAIVTYSQYINEQIIMQRRSPEEVELQDGMIIVPLTQEDTAKLREHGDRICVEVQLNLLNGAVAKTKTGTIIISPTLATEYIDGNYPSADMPDEIYDFETDEVIYIKGDRGEAGPPGAPGVQGETPYIGANGNWWIGGKDTGKPASYKLEASENGDAIEISLSPDPTAGGGSGGNGGGANGVTFTPSVSPEGVISWTNDGGLPNPEPVDIKGPKGDIGEMGPEGEPGDDYVLTDIDKHDIAVLAAEMVTIPTESKFELIETITVDETVNIIERTQEPDGTPYSFLKMGLKCKFAKGTVEKSVNYTFNNSLGYVLTGSNHMGTVDRWGIVYASALHGAFDGYTNWGGADQYAASNMLTVAPYRFMRAIDKFTAVKIQAAGGEPDIQSGSIIEIYGVKYNENQH